MLKFIKLKHLLIKQEDISYIEYYIDKDSDVEQNELQIETIQGDVYNIKYEIEEEYNKEVKYILEESDLFKINEGVLINLNQISAIEFYEDTVGPNDCWATSISWKNERNLPSTFVLDDVVHDEETINILMESIEEGISDGR